MLVNLSDWHRPVTVSAALALLRRGGGSVIPAAGLTTLARQELPRVTGVIDLTTLPLAYIKRERGGLRVGAGVTIGELVRHPGTARYAGGLLRQCGLAVGSTLNRNLITCGGNIAQCYFWSCLPVTLLVLDAEISVARGRGRRHVPAAAFFARPPGQLLGSDALVTDIVMPALPKGTRAGFRKVAPTATAFAYVTAAVLLRVCKGKITTVRAALGGLAALPQRFPEIEKEFANAPAAAGVFAKLAARLAGQCRVLPDMRVSAEYKRALVEALVADILTELRDEAAR